ncbi:MAG: hypothetical protein PUH84_03850 [Firmicutes bacterium]|nr:hypothetical protein [Bacillota bacterium]MDY5336193.1 hypothetical protein [Bacilli bacterium]
MEEIKININSADSLLMAINEVVRNTYNTKGYDDKKHNKTEEITQTVKKEWSNYVEAVLLSQILRNLNATDKLTPNGKQLYNQLAAKAGKRDSYFINFKKSIETKSTGLYAKYTPSSRSKIVVNGNSECILLPEGGRKDAFALSTSLISSKLNLLEKFEKISTTLAVPSMEQVAAKASQMSRSVDDLKFSGIENTIKNDLNTNAGLRYLESVKNSLYAISRQKISVQETIDYMNKYMAYFTPETKAVLNNFIKELESLTKELTAEEEMILNNLNKKEVEVSEKAHGKIDINRLVALMAMVERKTDSKGNELSKEKLQEYEQELERASKENSIAYQEALRIYNLSKQSQINNIRIESEEKNKAVIPDEGLSHDDLKEREFYYNRLVVETRNNDIIDKPLFNQMYDKYLKAELDDPYAIELMVQSYLEFYDYYNEAKRRAELTGEPIKTDYANWEEFVDKRMQEEGYNFGNVGKGR